MSCGPTESTDVQPANLGTQSSPLSARVVAFRDQLQAEMAAHVELIGADEAVILKSRLPNGGTSVVDPWFGNVAIYQWLKASPADPQVRTIAKKWLTWQLRHVNDPAVVAAEIAAQASNADFPFRHSSEATGSGLEYVYCPNEIAEDFRGTIFRHDIQITQSASGRTVTVKRRPFSKSGTKPSHTATDNWSGSVVLLASLYHQLAGATDPFVAQNAAAFDVFARHLERLVVARDLNCAVRDRGGFTSTRAAPESTVYYSADNVFSARALLDWGATLSAINGGGAQWTQLGSAIVSSLQSRYQAVQDEPGLVPYLYWSVTGGVVNENPGTDVDWSVFYGDAVNNLYALFWDVPVFTPEEARSRWQTFLRHQARWSYGATLSFPPYAWTDAQKLDYGQHYSPWMQLGVAAVLAGDGATATTVLDSVIDRVKLDKLSLDPDQIGWTLRLIDELSRRPMLVIDVTDDGDAAAYPEITRVGVAPSAAYYLDMLAITPLSNGEYVKVQPALERGWFFPHLGGSYGVATANQGPLELRFHVPETGYYKLSMSYVARTTRDPNVKVVIFRSLVGSGTTEETVFVDQTVLPNMRTHHVLGTYFFRQSREHWIRIERTDATRGLSLDAFFFEKQ